MESAEVSTLSRDETSELGWILTNAMEKPYLVGVGVIMIYYTRSLRHGLAVYGLGVSLFTFQIQYIKESRHFDEYRYMSHQYEHLGTNWASYIGEQ